MAGKPRLKIKGIRNRSGCGHPELCLADAHFCPGRQGGAYVPSGSGSFAVDDSHTTQDVRKVSEPQRPTSHSLPRTRYRGEPQRLSPCSLPPRRLLSQLGRGCEDPICGVFPECRSQEQTVPGRMQEPESYPPPAPGAHSLSWAGRQHSARVLQSRQGRVEGEIYSGSGGAGELRQ